MSVDYKWANAIMDQLKGCQAENARLREEAAAMTTALQKVEHLESEVARLRLTDEERESTTIAVEYVGSAFQVEHHAAVLRGLLERMK